MADQEYFGMFPDPDGDTTVEDMEPEDDQSLPVTRDDITFVTESPVFSPSVGVLNGYHGNGYPGNQSYRSRGQQDAQDHVDPHYNSYMPGVSRSRMNSDDTNTGKTSLRPTLRIGVATSKQPMVIFNGDSNVLRETEPRATANKNRNIVFNMDNFISAEKPVASYSHDLEETGDIPVITPYDSLPYPSLPREKSNLMPPIETNDSDKIKE